MKKSAVLFASAVIAATCIAAPAIAQDKAKAPAAPAADKAKPAEAKKIEPGTTKNLIDNDKVLVFQVTYKPGQGTELRERGPRVVHALTSGTMERTYPDGKKESVQWKAGETKYFAKDNFANKNAGKTDMVLLVTNIK